MTKPSARSVSERAADYVLSDTPPTYADMDCYRFVRQCVRDAGGDMAYAGTNDLYRTGVTDAMPISQALKTDALKSGWALFILREDTDLAPAKYRGDGIGDVYHMGLYLDLHRLSDGAYVEVAHSSQSRGQVAPSTLQNAWTHAAKLRDVSYAEWEGEETDQTPTLPDGQATTPAPSTPVRGIVTTTEGGLVLRTLPGGKTVPGQTYLLSIPRGSHVTITRQVTQGGEPWGQTSYTNRHGTHTGWVSMAYITLLDAVGTPAQGTVPGDAAPSQDGCGCACKQ